MGILLCWITPKNDGRIVFSGNPPVNMQEFAEPTRNGRPLLSPTTDQAHVTRGEGVAPPGLLLAEASLISIGLTIIYTDWRKS